MISACVFLLLLFHDQVSTSHAPLDWKSLLQDLTGENSTIQQAASKRVSGSFIPELVEESISDLQVEIPPLARLAVGSENDGIKLQASALLATLSQLRPDFESVLRPSLSLILEGTSKEKGRVRVNLYKILLFSSPAIPEGAIDTLIPALKNTQEEIRLLAVYGLTKMAAIDPKSLAAIKGGLKDSAAPTLQLAIINSIKEVRLSNASINEVLGNLLVHGGPSLARPTLEAIGRLGPITITQLQSQLEKVGESSDKDLAGQANRLLSRVH